MNDESSAQVAAQRPPRSPGDLFIAFSLLALQGFGGVLAVVQHELVERHHWLSREEFVEEWAVAQILPGPNAVNLSLIVGTRYFGLRGALAAFAGILTIPVVLVLLFALLYAQYGNQPQVAGALRRMGAVAAGLIIANGLKLLSALKRNPLGVPICVALGLACFFSIVVFHWRLVYVLPALGVVSCLLVYRRLKA